MSLRSGSLGWGFIITPVPGSAQVPLVKVESGAQEGTAEVEKDSKKVAEAKDKS